MLSPLSPEEDPADILELVNKARLVLEMPALRKLPSGIPETSRKCVLGRSLGVDILLDDCNRAYALLLRYHQASRLARAWAVARPCGMWNDWAVQLPGKLNRFVHEFDSRCYPALELLEPPASAVVSGDLRHLRFEWAAEHTKVVDLLERARSTCERAVQARNQPDRATLLELAKQTSSACERARNTATDWVDEHPTIIGLLRKACELSGKVQEAQNEPLEAHSTVVDLLKRARLACDRAQQIHAATEQISARIIADAWLTYPAPTRPGSDSEATQSRRNNQ
jgi:hypothetical protein